MQALQKNVTFTGHAVFRAAYLREIVCVDDLLSRKPAEASNDLLQGLVKNPQASPPLYLAAVWQDAKDDELPCSNLVCGQKSKTLFGGRCWSCFVKPPPPNADVQPQLTSVGCKVCGTRLSKISADAYEDHCWTCYNFECEECAAPISKTSFKELNKN